jgi:FKBP-type peptidyl-prolyl cis-trans isomerase
MISVPSLARRAILPIALALAVISTGCLGTTELPAEAQVETTDFASSLGVDLTHSVKLESGVVIRDVVVGSGRPIAIPDSAFVNYAGFLPNGVKFDPTTSATAPLAFKLGETNIITGFQLGVIGMQVGGTRQILIPPSLAYGQNGALGNNVIVFNVELTAIK